MSEPVATPAATASSHARDDRPAVGARPDSPAEALGRRILSTAFVRVGPDGQLTVERHDGRVLILRDVVVRARDYCGMPVAGGARYCGGFAEVAAARPGGGGGGAPVPQ